MQLFLGAELGMIGLIVTASYAFDITKAESAIASVFAFLDGKLNFASDDDASFNV